MWIEKTKKLGLNVIGLFLIAAVTFAIRVEAATAQKIILIDPGHGTTVNDNSPVEGKIELEIGLKLKSELEKAGYKVIMTRTANNASIGAARSADQDNINRAAIANNNKADLAIRLHSDSHNEDRFWIIYPDEKGKDRTGFSGPLSNQVIPESKRFASILASALKQDGFKGITKGESTYSSQTKADLLIFSAHSKVPVVTYEIYGHNSSSLRTKYSTDTTQRKVVSAVSTAVKSYFGSQLANSTTNQSTAQGQDSSSAVNKEYCPPEAPAQGPGSGADYRAQIAKAFEEQLALLTREEGGGAVDENIANLPQPSNKIAQIALAERGYQGVGPCKGNKLDRTKYNGMQCTQWCAAFVTWVVKQAGFNIPSISSSREVLNWYRSNGHSVFADPSAAAEGDIVVWSRGPSTGHIGIVVSNDGNTILTVEGNTSRDIVALRQYSHSSIKTNQNGLIGFGRW